MKIAVIFPGIGYHSDKPLLYYSSKLAQSMGYEVIKVTYPVCEVNLKEANREQILGFVGVCIDRVSSALKDKNVSKDDDVLFISKSIGTAIAAAYAVRTGLMARHILFTPLEETFIYANNSCGIAFNGTKDNWADCENVVRLCKEKNIPVTTVKGANHSLETGDVLTDTENLCDVMKSVEKYIKNIGMQ